MVNETIATFLVFEHIPPMGGKFHGSLSELKDKLAPLGLIGEWRDLPNGIHKFQCKDNGGLSWSETKGTVWFDGPGPATATLTTKVEAVLSADIPIAPVQAGSQ